MPTRRTLEKTVSHVLELVDKVSKKPVDPIYDEIKKWFEENRDLFPKLKHFEDELKSKIAELEQAIDNAAYDDGKRDAEIVQGIDKCLRSIKDLISEINLDKYEVSQPRKEEAQSDGRKMSDEWLALGIEESILESPAMATLELSYTILDLPLKMCLLCFAIFPEKAIIMKRQLIYWWIGEGFVRKTREKTAEEVGEEYFQKLIDMGLIYPKYKKAKQDKKESPESPVVDSCTMHPWIRRMVITVAKKAEFFDLDRRGAPTDVSSQSRRICFAKDLKINQTVTPPNTDESEDQLPSLPWFNRDQKYQLPFVTLFNIDQKYVDIKEEWFSKLNRVSVLQLGRWQHAADHHVEVENQDFLKHLGALTHLKYLSLRGMSRITELPSSVVDLVLLQILDLRACHNLERLPPDISSLRKLTHLDLSECYLLESMPKGLDKLFSLQVLKGFVIETSRRRSGKLMDLSQLKKLRKLSIYIGSQDLAQQEELHSLKDIQNLRVLTITWKEVAEVKPKGSAQSEEEHERDARKSFLFPSKLEKLDLRCIPFKNQPEWLKPSLLFNLKSLYIRGGKLDGLATETNQKWKVKILRLKYLDDFQTDDKILLKDFPDLKYFEKIKTLKGDEVWGKESYEEDEKSGENKATETKQDTPIQGEEKMIGEMKASHIQESSQIPKQDDDKVLSNAVTPESETKQGCIRWIRSCSTCFEQNSGKEEEEEMTTEKSREPVKGVPNKIEGEKASSSKVLTNEPKPTSTSVGKEETKADTKVQETKTLVKQGDNDQVPNKVEGEKANSSKGKEETKADTKVQETKALVKQGDNDQVPNKVKGEKANSSKGKEETKADTKVQESKGPMKQGDNDQVPNKVEGENRSTSKELTNEPNLTSTIVRKEETKADTKVEESKGLVKQGDNDQVVNKVVEGSTNKLISDESRLVSPIVNE
ncbi:disease resistance protein RGA5-like isoform X2 [Vitis riparia]|uniref:disease resistance protein RGA5-like isoform X2 n=1 Tax=Vitis riparia TaxID=96939 RepID=UPI00155A718C|nr:disease resistance protein RGA5-like isoform X2 [Vitis riparia]